MRYTPLVIIAALTGLAALTPTQNVQAGPYVYRYYDYDLVTVKSYTTYTDYDMFVSSWSSTGTRTESFVDGGGRTWSLVESTYSITPGYSYTGKYWYADSSEWRYYRMCGRTYYSVSTGCYYYRCACGRTFYYRP